MKASQKETKDTLTALGMKLYNQKFELPSFDSAHSGEGMIDT